MDHKGAQQQGILAIDTVVRDDRKYQVQQWIGKGTFGEVYKVLEMGTGEVFALKAANGTKGITLLEKEFNLLSKLRGVSGFTRVHDYVKLDSGKDYVEAMVLDLVNGTDLKKKKWSDGPLGAEQQLILP